MKMSLKSTTYPVLKMARMCNISVKFPSNV